MCLIGDPTDGVSHGCNFVIDIQNDNDNDNDKDNDNIFYLTINAHEIYI